MTGKPPRKSIIANFGALSRTADDAPATDAAPSPAPVARVGAGIIGATQRTLTEIREERDRLLAKLAEGGSGIRSIDPDLIEPSPYPDRLPDDNEADFFAFRSTIEQEGQKLPIQLRPHPEKAGCYQIIYGHRRWRACRELGRTVKALIVEMTDQELVIVQGLENAARQDLTWIERALFAGRMEQAGVRARDIRASLAIDDPELARFRQVWRAVPGDIIQRIGRAPKIGRPRWGQFVAALAAAPDVVTAVRAVLAHDDVATLPSDDRFRRALEAVQQKRLTVSPEEMTFRDGTGKPVAHAVISGREIRLSARRGEEAAFTAFFKAEFPELMRRFSKIRGEQTNP